MLRPFKQDRGFTIIELLIVSVIVGLVAAMAVPRVQIAYDRMQFTSTHRELISTLKLARSLAITEKNHYGVYLDGDATTITLYKDKTAGGHDYVAGTDSVIRIDTLPIHTSYLGSDIENNAILFAPNGSADFGGGGNIFMMASSPDILGIFWTNVLASTGRIDQDAVFY
jgi:prepilin-type N-terminal cleavage/methylation domain-containing protein